MLNGKDLEQSKKALSGCDTTLLVDYRHLLPTITEEDLERQFQFILEELGRVRNEGKTLLITQRY